jgi:bud site selection protein 20
LPDSHQRAQQSNQQQQSTTSTTPNKQQPTTATATTTLSTMGTGKRQRGHRNHTKKKGFKKYSLSTKHRSKDLDQIQDEIEAGGLKFEFDADIPGGGQFYCEPTGKHFCDQRALDDHMKSKPYKKRLKEIREEKYTQNEANYGAGMSKEVLPPAHPVKDADEVVAADA